MELIIAVLVFSFMMASMSAIYSTITRNTHQNYRQDMWKTNTAMAMRTIQQNLIAATRIDSPAAGGVSDHLNFAVNVDQLTGCAPIGPGPITWHHFYRTTVVTPGCPSGSCLYYCSGPIPTGGSGACSSAALFFWNPPGGVYPVCAAPILLLSNVTPRPGVPVFSRQMNEKGVVAVNLRILWNPGVLATAGADLSTSQRTIDYSLQTVVRVIIPAI